jgi:hypothetical protein
VQASAERDVSVASAAAGVVVPIVPDRLGEHRLQEIVAYGRKTYDLRQRLRAVRDGREGPDIAPSLVAASVLFCGLLRIRSFNALEPRLGERRFRRLIDAEDLDASLSADTLSRSLRTMALETVRPLNVEMIKQAERNKAFREGWYGALRYAAFDGWEPICSYEQHCTGCLVRMIKVKQSDGEVKEVPQYYHRYVVAMMIDDRLDLALDIEPLLPHDLRPKGAAKDAEDEGELTAARRLLRRVKKTYPWIDCTVTDGLYANGPWLTLVKELRMSAISVMRKEGDEPLKEALSIWGDEPAQRVVEDKKAGERIELWDCRDLRTLSSYDGPIRVVRGRVSELDEADAADATQSTTWCMVVTGEKANRLADRLVLAVARGRWHIENTGFHQWTTRWEFAHVFVHDAHGILALYWLFFAAFNLLTLFLYRQLRCFGRDRGKDVTQTISRLIDLMLENLARLDRSPWDTS